MSVSFVLPALSTSTLIRLIRKDDARLGRSLAAHAWSLRTVANTHGPALAAFLNLPLAEVLASPFAFRMCAMGAKVGASSVAHESRRVLRPHRSIAVDGEAPGWRDGVLHASKYQQFAADEPCARTGLVRAAQERDRIRRELQHRKRAAPRHPSAPRRRVREVLQDLHPIIGSARGRERRLQASEIGANAIALVLEHPRHALAQRRARDIEGRRDQTLAELGSPSVGVRQRLLQAARKR